MKAAYYEKYGPASVVEIRDVERPVLKPNQVLVKIHASAVTTADWRLRAAAFPGVFALLGRMAFGLFAPRNKILGGDFAGSIVEVGADVTKFTIGEEVFGFALNGAHAEFMAVSEDDAIVKKPIHLSDEEAAAIPFGAICALLFLRDFAKLQPGQKILINGASGGVGVYAVQLAKYFGAEVTGVCSATNLDLVSALGADHVIDYASEDFTHNGETYDVIFDTVGKTSFAKCKHALTPKGLFIPLEFELREIFQALATWAIGGKRVKIGVNDDSQEDLLILGELLAQRIIQPVIDRSYPLARIADAHRYVEQRHRRGAVVLSVSATPDLQLLRA